MPTANAEGWIRSEGGIGMVLQIDTGPRRSPSACAEILRKKRRSDSKISHEWNQKYGVISTFNFSKDELPYGMGVGKSSDVTAKLHSTPFAFGSTSAESG